MISTIVNMQRTKTMKKQCPICGEYIPVESTICEYCGENIAPDNTNDVEQVENVQENESISDNNKDIKEEPKTAKKYFILLVILISIALLWILMFAVMDKYGKSTDTAIYTQDKDNGQQEQTVDKDNNKEIEEAKQYFKEKKYEQAATILEKEIENSQNPTAYFYLGRIYQEQNYTDLAIENFKKAIANKKDFFEPLLELTKIYYNKNNYSLALDYGTSALKIKNNNKELLKILLQIYIDKDDDLDKIFEISKLLVKVDPKNFDANVGAGLYYHKKDNFKTASTYLKQALDVRFERDVALLLARDYMEVEQYTNAINVLDKILSDNPYDYEAGKMKQEALYQRNLYIQKHNQVQQNTNTNQNESEDLLFN